MRESRTFGSVGGEGGNVLAYPANTYGSELMGGERPANLGPKFRTRFRKARKLDLGPFKVSEYFGVTRQTSSGQRALASSSYRNPEVLRHSSPFKRIVRREPVGPLARTGCCLANCTRRETSG
jgi:hypothetical protein